MRQRLVTAFNSDPKAFIFVCSTVTVNMLNIKFCRWVDSNCGSLGLEAYVLPTEPQPLL